MISPLSHPVLLNFFSGSANTRAHQNAERLLLIGASFLILIPFINTVHHRIFGPTVVPGVRTLADPDVSNDSVLEDLEPEVQTTDVLNFSTRSATLPRPVSDQAATTSGNKIYNIGGCDAEEGYVMDAESLNMICPHASSIVTAYDLTADAFTEMARMPTARMRHSSTAINGKIWAVGGRDHYDNVVGSVDVSSSFSYDCAFLFHS